MGAWNTRGVHERFGVLIRYSPTLGAFDCTRTRPSEVVVGVVRTRRAWLRDWTVYIVPGFQNVYRYVCGKRPLYGLGLWL